MNKYWFLGVILQGTKRNINKKREVGSDDICLRLNLFQYKLQRPSRHSGVVLSFVQMRHLNDEKC